MSLELDAGITSSLDCWA